MDDLLVKALIGAASASPFAALAIWVIRWAFGQIEKRDARIAELTNALFRLAQSGERTAAVALGVKPEIGG